MGTDSKTGIMGSEGAVQAKIAPKSFYIFCFIISLTLPNLIFSGAGWYDTLHIMKWAVSMVPVAMIAVVAGWRLLVRPVGGVDFRIDPFGWVWLILVIFFTLQPFWAPIKSIGTFMKEWLFFITLFAAYLFAYNFFPSPLHHWILWGASLNAALNVIFAEIMTRLPESPLFFIMNVPGHYIGNTGQQEMFGLWMAMALFNSIFLYIRYSLADEKSLRGKLLIYSNFILMLVNSWGLWNSTARGGILSLIVGFIVVTLMMWRNRDFGPLKRAITVFSVIFLLLLVTLSLGKMDVGRSSPLVYKMMDMVQNPTAVGARRTIWQTSMEMIRLHPATGVGLGHYKWNYLDAQRSNIAADPNFIWQFTYWAHSEYLQWAAEAGIFGTLVLAVLGAWWLWRFIKALKEGKSLSHEAIWACGMLFLIWFDALFSRPFHRIENALWMSVAFALVNRELLPETVFWSRVKNPRIYKYFGALMMLLALGGLLFFAGGLMGDQYLLKAAKASDLPSKKYYLERAERHVMTRDEAREKQALLDIEVARLTKDEKLFRVGLSKLYSAFEVRPTSALIFSLYGYAKMANYNYLFNQIAPYLRIRNGEFNNEPDPPVSVEAFSAP